MDFKFDKQNEITICKWYDNRPVVVATNFGSVDVHKEAKRRCKKKGTVSKDIHIPIPDIIDQYNQGMGGVDHLDWMIAKYRTVVRSKKYYWSLFTNILDISCTNAYLLFKLANEGAKVRTILIHQPFLQ